MPQTPHTSRHIALDLGAESGRVMLGTLDAGRLTLEEAGRFANGPEARAGGLFWDLHALRRGIAAGLSNAAGMARAQEDAPQSISVNSWGVDYVPLVNDSGLDPHHYRDARTDDDYAILDDDLRRLIFESTGVQFMSINTLYQLLDDTSRRPSRLAEARAILTIADYFNWLFCGRVAVEASLASTTQVFDPRSRQWSGAVIDRFGLPMAVFPEVVESGTVLGEYRDWDGDDEHVGLAGVKVVASCSHDTACAVAATPGEGDDWAYLSSGTWSLLGVELPSPVITERCRELNFTNEQGYAGTTRLLKNLSGLFILQECRRIWAEQGDEYDYATLATMAESAEPWRSLIRPDAADFGTVGDMPARIADYCRRTDQPVPQSPGEYARCVYESLALLYRTTLGQVEDLSGRTIRRLHVVGGGSRATLLNQLTADATGRTVVAGPVEATAAGNVLIQAATLGHVADGLAGIRRVVRDSFELATYEPQQPPPADVLDRFDALPR